MVITISSGIKFESQIFSHHMQHTEFTNISHTFSLANESHYQQVDSLIDTNSNIRPPESVRVSHSKYFL